MAKTTSMSPGRGSHMMTTLNGATTRTARNGDEHCVLSSGHCSHLFALACEGCLRVLRAPNLDPAGSVLIETNSVRLYTLPLVHVHLKEDRNVQSNRPLRQYLQRRLMRVSSSATGHNTQQKISTVSTNEHLTRMITRTQQQRNNRITKCMKAGSDLSASKQRRTIQRRQQSAFTARVHVLSVCFTMSFLMSLSTLLSKNSTRQSKTSILACFTMSRTCPV